jgi:hypothetical protein
MASREQQLPGTPHAGREKEKKREKEKERMETKAIEIKGI